MLTSEWSKYCGPGRVAVSPVPKNTPRGYRRHEGLFLRHPVTPAELRARLADLNPHAIAAELHALVYPHEPVIMGGAPAGVPSYRIELARWLAFWTGEPVKEIDPTTYHPQKVRPDHRTRMIMASLPSDHFAPRCKI